MGVKSHGFPRPKDLCDPEISNGFQEGDVVTRAKRDGGPTALPLLLLLLLFSAEALRELGKLRKMPNTSIATLGR